MEIKEIDKTIKNARLKMGISQRKLADLLSVTPATVCNWENAKSIPSVEMFYRIADTLNLSLNPELEPVNKEKNKETFDGSFGEIIRVIRTLSGISQAELAKKLDVSQPTIGSWERCATEPSIEKIKQLCRMFNVSACELLGLVCYEEDSKLFDLIKMYSLLNKVGQEKVFASVEDIFEIPKYTK